MDFDHALFRADLDALPWASYGHAYGSAEDVPGCLRALAGDDDAAADEAQGELYGSILHQGSVYEASAQAVPFLARIAAADIRTADVLLLIGGIAEGGEDPSPEAGDGPPAEADDGSPAEAGDGLPARVSDEAGESDEVACRRAVVAQLPLLLGALDHQDRAVRQAAAWAAGWTGTAGADTAVPALRDRAAVETDPLVRAELLSALAQLGPEGTARAATEAIGPDGSPPELRMAALLACVDIGLPWTPAHHEAALALLPLDRLMADRFDQVRNEPLHHLTVTLLLRDTDPDREAVFALLDGALRHGDPEARTEAVWAALTACELSRGAPARLVAALTAAALADGGGAVASAGDGRAAASGAGSGGGGGAAGSGSVGGAAGSGAGAASGDGSGALSALGRLGAYGKPAADLLAARAAGEGDVADRALEALVTVDPVRAAPLLARDLESRPRAFAAACGGPVGSLPTLPYDPELLAAVRRRLGAMEPGSMALPRLAALLTAWGPDAGPAVPELLAQLPAYPRQLPKVLAAVCLPEQRAEVAEALRSLARTAPADDRMEAVRVLHQLTGDHGPLLSLLAERLAAGAGGGDSALRETATAAAALGPAAAPLVPALRAALNAPDADRNNPQMDADIAIAVALHRITGDAAEAVPVLAGVLGDDDGLWRRWTFVRAAEAAAGLGPAGRPLVPVLKGLLADPEQVPSAVLALRAVAPDALDTDRSAGLLLDAAEAGAAPAEAVEALVALGVDTLSDEHRDRLTELGERDLRAVRFGLSGTIEAADDRLRARIRTAVVGGVRTAVVSPG
ncbi:HEAT repeat domain-containing protein [Streptomyces sp. CFMR 7]|uniref:HEAT repeat domain-containing protein n=1 Tax=Streptomyces sp. CFMR 7 TaxID=1649184 RepID=UPI0021B6A7FF|nr:HEAT repeat domain-containing protein [Streptomyces sp. CFMR 7]